jgi:hypothetical protein
MEPKTERRPESRRGSRDTRAEQREPVPTWRNTRPRGNPEPDREDLERSRERFESLLGR